MGNNHGELKDTKLNPYKNKKSKSGKETEVNSEDEKETEKNNKISDYDEELSSILFDEDTGKENGNKKHKKSNKKKTLTEELSDYAEQIAEEKFMEEINKSKSTRKILKKKEPNSNESDDDDEDEDDYAAFKRWKARQKNKNKKKEEKNKKNKENNNIKIINKDNDNNDDNLNINKEIKKKKLQEKKRVNSSDKIMNFKNNIKEKNEKLDIKKQKSDGDNNKQSDKNKEEFIKNSMKNYLLLNQLKSNTFKNQIPNENNKDNTKIDKSKYNTNTYTHKLKESQTFVIKKNNNQEKEKPKNFIIDFFKKKLDKTEATKNNIYSKVKKENIRIVTLYLKNGNIKSQEGLKFCGFRKYNQALTCFAQARNSFMQLSKLINNDKKNYPEEFRKLINEKLNEKIKLANQSIKECNDYIKKGKNADKTNNVNNILKNLNFKQDYNINNSFSQIDDNFDFNSEEQDQNSNFRSGKPNQNNVNKNNKNIHQDEDSKIDAKVETEIMIANPGVKFSDIIGMQEMKKILYEIIIVPAIRPDFFTGIRKPQRGILLFGPPGTGKTMIAKAIASECKSTFFNISASSLTSKWVGESEKTVKSLFKLAYKKSPSIIFIDEIDSILSKRTESENEATKRLKTEFLIQFDGLGSDNNSKLLVIAATNRPMDLDEALLRRLPKRVYCGPLDENGRFEFIKKVINKVETNLSDKDIKDIAKMTNGYSNSDLKELCKEAAFQPVRELTMEQILKIKKFRPLVKNDLVLAVNKIRGSLSNKIIGELMRWNEQFGGI